MGPGLNIMLSPDDTQIEYDGQEFRDLDLSHTELAKKEFYQCVFSHCDFTETAFSECHFNDCQFIACNLSLMKVNKCAFSNVRYDDSKLVGVNWALASWPRFQSDCSLELDKCVISYSTFSGLNLQGISIKECFAKSVDFREADLTRANFDGTDLTDSQFVHTNLTKADLTGARNYTIDVTLNKVRKAKFSLPEAVSLLYCLDIEMG